MTEQDAARVEATLRSAPWDLPVREELVTSVLRTPARPRRRPRVRTAAAAAVVLLAAGGMALRSTLPPSAAVRPHAPAPAPARSVEAAVGRIELGGFVFDAPPGFAAAGPRYGGVARFGPQGLQNDGAALGPRDMRVELESRLLQPPDGSAKLVVDRIVPVPTAGHPGPRPARDPADADAAARTIVDIESRLGVAASARTEVTGLPVGPATLVRFDDRNAVLLARPAGRPAQVLMFTVGAGSVDVLLQFARSARR